MRAIKDKPRDDDVETSFAQKDTIRSKMKRKREDLGGARVKRIT